MKKQTGFTLIELIVAIAIFGIMASIAIPNYSSFIMENRKSSLYNTLVGTISLARLEAVKTSRVVTMCISSNLSTCDDTTDDWNTGWIVFTDLNGDGLVTTTSTPADTILKVERAAVPGLNIKSDEFDKILSIAPRGRLRTQGSFVICDDTEADENGMALNLWITGLGRLATDTESDDDTDEIVEDIAGDNISCSASETSD